MPANANLRQALEIIAFSTDETFRLWDLAGRHNAARRQKLMGLLLGKSVPQSACGVNALSAELYRQLSIPDGCAAEREERFAIEALRVLTSEPSADPEQSARESVDAEAPRAEVLASDPFTCPRCGIGSAADCRCTFPEPMPSQEESDAMRRSFGTRPAKPLRPAAQDSLFNPLPQQRIVFPSGGH